MNRLRSLIVILLCFSSAPVFAWGERGHDLVTRVAVRLLAAQNGTNEALSLPFTTREQMLGHVANVPDIVWRNLDRSIQDQNAPTHYIDLEYFSAQPTIDSIPRSVDAAEAQIEALCAKPAVGYACPTQGPGKPKISAVGSAPWRINQLFNLLQSTFAAIKSEQDSPTKDAFKKIPRSSAKTPHDITSVNNALVNKALLYAGIMSHFVGDLGQPLHTTRDYNGWESNAGGLHSYFESQVVDSLDLSLDFDVYNMALNAPLFDKLEQMFSASERPQKSKDPFAIAIALSLNSFSEINQIKAIDKKVALNKPSITDSQGVQKPALRKAPALVAAAFRPLITRRLATSAVTLAYLWRLAWENAGRPDMSRFSSFDYAISPEFIPLDYKR